MTTLVDTSVPLDVLASSPWRAWSESQLIEAFDPDFFIGAHAETADLTLLTRDPTRIRTYFPDVDLVAPD